MENKLPKLLCIFMIFTIFASCKKSETVSSGTSYTVKSNINTDAPMPYCSGDASQEGTRYITGKNAIVAGSIVLDANDNVYSTGHYTGTHDFDPDNLAAPLPDHAGVFLDKLTSKGLFSWVIQLYSYDGAGYGLGQDSPGANGFYTLPLITPDANGNIYVLYTVTQTPKSGGMYTTIHLSKYSSTGSMLWSVQQFAGLGYTPAVMRLNASNNISICSNYDARSYSGSSQQYTADPIDFGLGIPGHVIVGTGAFVQKINSSGKFVSVTPINATFQLIGLDPNGNIFDAGTDAVTSRGYIRKFSATGDYVWFQTLAHHMPQRIITDDNGNAIMLSTPGNEMGKYDAAGNLIWHIINLNTPKIFTTDGAGDTYVAGNFTGTANFNPNGGTFNLSSPGISSLYVQKFDALGNFVWAKKTQFESNQSVMSLAADPTSYIYVVGELNAKLGSNPLYYQNLYGTKISQCE